jgi:hypothetical protein
MSSEEPEKESSEEPRYRYRERFDASEEESVFRAPTRGATAFVL